MSNENGKKMGFSDTLRNVSRSIMGFADDQSLTAAGFTPDMALPEETAPAEEPAAPTKSPEDYRMGLEAVMANEAIAKEDKAKVEKAIASLDEIKKMLDDISKVADELIAKYPAAPSAPAEGAMV